MMKESIAVTGEPVPDPMLGCGFILLTIGIVVVISIIGYLLFKIGITQLILGCGILAIVFGTMVIVLCLKVRNHEV